MEVTKKGIRSGIFKQVRRNQYSAKLKYNYYNCIPWFTDSDDPVNKLKELDLFKNAENVLVGYDKAQESIKYGFLIYLHYVIFTFVLCSKILFCL